MPRRSKQVASVRSSAMFATVTPVRARCQLSSSVSIETTTVTSRMATALRNPIQRADPPAPPPGAEDDDFARHALCARPVAFVRIGAGQEIEPLVPTLDRAADHHAHEDEADACVFPLRGAAALVEVDRVGRRESVPGRGRLPIQIQRREPEPPAPRHFLCETELQPLQLRLAERARTVPTLLVQPHQVPPSLGYAIRIVRERGSVVTTQAPFLAAHRLTARGAEGAEVGVPRVRQFEPGARP